MGSAPPQTPALLGRGHPLPKFHPLGACGASTLAPSALDMCENPGSASGL